MTADLLPLERAHLSLQGLCVGDSLGAFLEGNPHSNLSVIVRDRKPPKTHWRYTDDTSMACSVYENLRRYGAIQQDQLAASFALRFQPGRGYGPGAMRILAQLNDGEDWRNLAPGQFGTGSYGSGGAMRVAPLGAYFAHDLDAAAVYAHQQCEVTHAHSQGIAGAVAVAVAAGAAWQVRSEPERPTRASFLDRILPYIPDGEVKDGITWARDVQSVHIDHIVRMLGNGAKLSSQDTVPFALFCAAEWLHNFEEAIWQTLSGGGDSDTLCAMVGGIVALYTGIEGIPQEWLQNCEALPRWAFEDEV